MGFVANLLDQVQQRRVFFEPDRLILLTQHKKNLFLFGDGHDGLVDDLEFLQSLRGCMQLTQAAIDQHEAGHRFIFVAQAAIAPVDRLSHAGKIVVAPLAANNEFAIVGFLHPAIFPNYHRGHHVGALNMRDIEALDAFRRRRKIEGGFQRFRHGFARGFEHAKALLERVARVLFDQIEKGMLWAALRCGDIDAPVGQAECGRAFTQRFLEQRAILEIARHVDDAREKRGVEIQLFEQRRQKLGGIKRVLILPIKIAPVHHASSA